MSGKWSARNDFDLSSVDVPRRAGEGDVVVGRIAPMVPFVLGEDEATVIVRLDGLTGDEVAALVEAVRADRCVLLAACRLYPAYPILIFSLFVYDTPGGPPLSIEGYRDVTSADVQDFVVRLGHAQGQGRVLLYGGEPLGLLATGGFVLRVPPLLTPPLPHRTSWRELRTLWLMFLVAVRQRDRIPARDRDFRAAARTHMAREPNLTARSEAMDP